MYPVGEDINLIGESETKLLTGIVLDCEVNIALAVKKLRSLGLKNVIFTLGKEGSAVVIGNEITLLPAVEGQTVVADENLANAVSSALGRGESAVDAVRFATERA